MLSNLITLSKQNYKIACSKSNVNDFWTIYFCRILAAIIVVIIRNMKVTPNHITYLSLFVHIIGIFFIIKSNYLIASSFIMLGQILDAADGQLAIIKDMKTIYGSYLDLVIDALKDLISFAVLIYIFNDTKYEISSIISLLIVCFSSILDWIKRHFLNMVKPSVDNKNIKMTFKEKYGIYFWTAPIRNFIIVLSLLFSNPQWIIIYTISIGLYMIIKRTIVLSNMIAKK